MAAQVASSQRTLRRRATFRAETRPATGLIGDPTDTITRETEAYLMTTDFTRTHAITAK